jgi:hypothetical protein
LEEIKDLDFTKSQYETPSSIERSNYGESTGSNDSDKTIRLSKYRRTSSSH